MAKLKFGNTTVVPVKSFKNDMLPGVGIDNDQYDNGVISVDNTVIRNIGSTASGSLLTQFGMSYDSSSGVTGFGRYIRTQGNGNTIVGHGASGAGGNTTVIGKSASGDNARAIAVGSQAVAHDIDTIVIGANGNSNFRGSIAIGYNTNTGNSHSSIVIGYNSKAYTNNDTYPSIIIGNDIDLSNTSSSASVIIGGKEKINGDDAQTASLRKKVGDSSVAIGYDAGCSSGYSGWCATAVGAYASSNGESSVALGNGAEARGSASIAIGRYSESIQTSNDNSNGSIAIGFHSSTRNSSNTSRGGIAIGSYATANSANYSIAIGRYSIATGNQSFAIGVSSMASGSKSLQLGQGSNSVDNSLNVFDYQLLKDGLIPKERLSEYTPLDGQVLYYDNDLGKLGWKDIENGGSGSYTLPVATTSKLGGIKVGSGLNITLDGTLSVRASEGTQWGQIGGRLSNQIDLQNALDNKQNVLQFAVMPTPSRTWENKIVQYIGEEDAVYKTGQFYQCTDDDYPTAICTSDTRWANLEVDAWMFANFVSKYFYNDNINDVPSKMYSIQYVDQFDGLGWILYENETSVYVKDIYKMGITAEGATPEEGDCVYVTLNMHASSEYAWRKLLVDAQVSVNNTLVSTSTKQALSANMGRVLNDKITELSGISHFLAMWDADTGVARYLETGYQYASGDYFIIATVGETSPTEHGSYTGTLGPGTSGNRSITIDTLTEEALESWENAFTKKAQRVKFSMDAQFNFSNDYNSNVYTQTELKQLFGINLTNFMSVGDSFFITYSSPINYMPDGSSYTGDSHSRTETTDPVQISDMYFYDGAHWVFLPSSSRQIAVDEDLDSSSRNPVENRVVTEALEEKLQKYGDENSLYVNDSDGNPTMVTLGSGLSFDWDNYEIINTKTSGAWGQITGNIEAQTDLVDYVNSHGGGSGNGTQLADVFVKDADVRNNLRQPYAYKGYGADIFFKIGADYDTLKSMRNDLYVTVARNNDANKARARHKFRIFDDANRFKLNKKFYCWRAYNMWSHYDWNTDYSEWRWMDGEPCETDYFYFYVEQDYNSDTAMKNDDPTIFLVPTHKEMDYARAWGTSFNELADYGNLQSFIDNVLDGKVSSMDFQRCPQYDIDTAISLNSNYSGSSRSSDYQYCNILKGNGAYGDWGFRKMQCRIYNINDVGKAFLWCYDWEDSSEGVYGYLDDEDILVSDYIPTFMGDLRQYCEVSQLDNLGTFTKKRSDLNYYRFVKSASAFRDAVDALRLATQDFPDDEGSSGGHNTNWNSYNLDYPIKPVRLDECKVYVYKVPNANGDHSLAQKYSSLVSRAYTFEEIEADEDLKHMVINQGDMIFVLPFDTHYLWMRILGFQKSVYYGDYNGDTDIGYAPWDRHNLRNCIKKAQTNQANINRRIYGFRPACYIPGTSNMYFYALQFNTIDADDYKNHCVSKMRPLSRKLWINGECYHGLNDQRKE